MPSALVRRALRALVEEGKDPPEMATDTFKSYNRWLRLSAEEGL